MLARVAAMNARWAAGGPSASLEAAGIFVSQIDVAHDATRPWRPCDSQPDRAWCWWISDRLPGSILNAHAPHLYAGARKGGHIKGGIVLAPSSVRVLCAYPSDGGTQGENKACAIAACLGRQPPCPSLGWMRSAAADDPRLADGSCVPGCSVDGQPPSWCDSPADPSGGCTWAADRLQGMLEQQQALLRSGHATKSESLYNEVVIDPATYVSALPGAVEAFVVTAGPQRAEDAAEMARVRQAFAAEYGLAGRSAPPLLVYDPHGVEGVDVGTEGGPFREV